MENTIINDNTVVETKEEQLAKEEADNNSSASLNPSDYKVIVDMIKEMEESYKVLRNSLQSSIESRFNLNADCMEYILPYRMEDIDTMDITTIREFLNKYSKSSCTRFDETPESEVREIFRTVKDAGNLLLGTKREADKLKEESADVLKDYFNYMTSDKVRASRQQRVDALKAALELETDEGEKSIIASKINAIENALNFAFLQERFEKFGDEEVQNIKKGYFDFKSGSYVIDRFKKKITKFGFKEELYKYFFNLEENFLPEEYHVFNNLFLYIYMRMTAYGDPYSKVEKMWVQALTGALANLIYHKFESVENEQEFLHVIMGVLDHFEPYRDEFVENNTTAPGHPARKEAELKHEENQRSILIKKMDELKITGYDKDASVEDLRKYLNDHIDEMIDSQISAAKTTEEDAVDENGVVHLQPNFPGTNSNVVQMSEASEEEKKNYENGILPVEENVTEEQ